MIFIDLKCPVCGNSGAFDGQGKHVARGEEFYRHRCPECGCIIDTPLELDGEPLSTGKKPLSWDE